MGPVAAGLEAGFNPRTETCLRRTCPGAHDHQAQAQNQREQTLQMNHQSAWNSAVKRSSDRPSTGTPSSVSPKLRSTPSGPLRVQA